MPQSIIDQLPENMAFLAPCAREMLAVRAARYRPSVNAREYPEQALADELDQCSSEYQRILGRALIKEFFSGSSDLFCERVTLLRTSLLKWMEPFRMHLENAEVSILFTIVGSLGHPEAYLETQRTD